MQYVVAIHVMSLHINTTLIRPIRKKTKQEHLVCIVAWVYTFLVAAVLDRNRRL